MSQTSPRRTPYLDSKGQRVTGIYTRQTKTGDTVFEIGWSENGKQRWKTVSGGITAAKTERAKELARIAKGDRTSSNPRLTFNAAADAWWTSHKPSCRPKSIESYELALKHLRPEFGRKRLAKISADDVARYIRAKQEGTKTQKPLKNWSILSHLNVLGQVFKYASRRLDYGGQNPVSLLERSERPRPSDDAKPQRALTPDELQHWLAAVDDAHRPIFEFAADTGARLSEVLGIAWGNLDLDEGSVSFTHQIDKKGRRVPLKTKRSRRTIEIPAELVSSLRKAKLAAPRSGRHDLVFATRNGTAYKANNIGSRVVGRSVKLAGLEDVVDATGEIVEHAPTFHTLRHTHGSMLIAAGWDIADVSARLGHADVNTTLKTYTHEFDKANRRKERRASLDRLSLTNASRSDAAVVELR